MGNRAIFLDRDGTLIRDVGFTHRVEDLHLLEGVLPGLARMAAMGFELLITTNQSGIARGLFTEDEMHAFHAALCQRLHENHIEIAAVYYCPYHPTEGIGRYRRQSPLRKPQPGMLLEAAAQRQLDLPGCYAIGDKPADVLAGQAAGCRTILVTSGATGRGELPPDVRPDFVAADLVEAARFIERTDEGDN